MKKHIKEIMVIFLAIIIIIAQVFIDDVFFLGVVDLSVIVDIEVVAIVLYFTGKRTKRALIVSLILFVSSSIVYALGLPEFSIKKSYQYLETKDYKNIEINDKYSTMTCKPRYGLVSSVYCFTAIDKSNKNVEIIFNPANGEYSVKD